VIEALGPEYRVVGLSAHRNVELLAEQTLRYRPQFVAVTHRDSVAKFRAILDGQAQVLSGPDCLTELVQSDEVDTVLAAVVGAAGLAPVMARRRGRQAPGGALQRFLNTLVVHLDRERRLMIFE
jgi:1-deoxy-D-xylulose-5-phosphate reductoisomerase